MAALTLLMKSCTSLRTFYPSLEVPLPKIVFVQPAVTCDKSRNHDTGWYVYDRSGSRNVPSIELQIEFWTEIRTALNTSSTTLSVNELQIRTVQVRT